jgi:flagellar basal-body rod modification protein FlgD
MSTPLGSVAPPVGTVGQQTGFTAGLPASSSATGGAGDKDMFLKLLVAQMKYQDPSKPTDASAFLAQTAQFTLVEKMAALAASQATMTQSSQLQAATSMVGQTVSWTGKDVKGADVAESGVVTGVSISASGTATLLVGDEEVAVGDVTKITKPS